MCGCKTAALEKALFLAEFFVWFLKNVSSLWFLRALGQSNSQYCPETKTFIEPHSTNPFPYFCRLKKLTRLFLTKKRITQALLEDSPLLTLSGCLDSPWSISISTYQTVTLFVEYPRDIIWCLFRMLLQYNISPQTTISFTSLKAKTSKSIKGL